MNEGKDIYTEPVVYRTNKFVTTVRRPILTEEVRERRMNLIKKAACDFVVATERIKNKEHPYI